MQGGGDKLSHARSFDEILFNWRICASCYFVSDYRALGAVSFKCSVCKNEDIIDKLFFDKSVKVALKLLQDACEFKLVTNCSDELLTVQLNHKYCEILGYFYATQDILFRNLILEICCALNLPEHETKKYCPSLGLCMQKRKKIFADLTGVSWQDSVVFVEEKYNVQCQEIDERLANLIIQKKGFSLSESHKKKEAAVIEAIEILKPSTDLYIHLHNAYVHQSYFVRENNNFKNRHILMG